jgi:hypothetical protein
MVIVPSATQVSTRKQTVKEWLFMRTVRNGNGDYLHYRDDCVKALAMARAEERGILYKNWKALGYYEKAKQETAKKILEELNEIVMSDGHFGLTIVIDTDDWNAFLARWVK